MNNSFVPPDAATITPSDTTEVGLVGIYVGGAGNVTVTTEKGNDVPYTNVPAGTTIVLGIRKVKATGTTATGIVGYKA